MLLKIRTIDINQILEKYERVDLLKIDIEGAERQVIPRMKEHLHKVKNIFVEYHSENGMDQCIKEIIEALYYAGFRIYIQEEYAPKQPFLAGFIEPDFDLQLNIFGIK